MPNADDGTAGSSGNEDETPPEDDAGDQSGDQDEDDQNDENPEDEPDENPEDEPEDTPEDNPDENPEDQSSESDRNLTWLWILLAVLALIALIVLAVLWFKKRIAQSDPIRLSADMTDMTAACLLLYRAILTLLSRYGLVPQGGETAQAFAERVIQTVPNESFVPFAADLAQIRYSGGEAGRETCLLGQKAYKGFLAGMKKRERLRYELRRAVSGNGDTENIP